MHKAIRMMGKNVTPPIIKCLFVLASALGKKLFFSVAISRMWGMIINPNIAEMKNGVILMRKAESIFLSELD